MTTLDISLCLPELDIVALAQKRSIVAVTRRFIVPDRSFVLMPCRADSLEDEYLYHPQVLNALKGFATPSLEAINATHWAQCVYCQPVNEEAIATLSKLTIWTANALSQRLKDGSLFLTFFRTYALPSPYPLDPTPVCEQIYKFIPLSNYLNVSTEKPVYSDDEFATAKQEILEPKTAESELEIASVEKETNKQESILDAPDWIEKISEVGNSSNGHDFEKLVRKGMQSLGFSNSLNQPMLSLDPNATGGAGGLDFYADSPYSIVGECKASAAGQVGRPVRQLHKLGTQWLGIGGYNRAIKLVIAAGKIAKQDEQFAVETETNVIRPETFQQMVALKMQGEELFNPSDLQSAFENLPFGKAADIKMSSFVEKWKMTFEAQTSAAIEFKKSQQRAQQIVQTVKELANQSIHKTRKGFLVVEVRSHYNAKYQPCLTDEEIREDLIGLTSPVAAGCLKRYSHPDSEDIYAFEKDMILPSL